MKILEARWWKSLGTSGFLFGLIGAVVFTCQSPADAAGLQTLQGHMLPSATTTMLIGPYAATNHLRLAIGLPLRNKTALAQLLKDLYDPASSSYHHYLTPQQFTDQFGPTAQDYQALSNFVVAHNLTVPDDGAHPNRVLLDVEGSVSDIEDAFNIHILEYNHPTETRHFYAPDTEPSVNLAVPLLDISGLNNYKLPYPKYKLPVAGAVATPKLGSGQGGNYFGKDFRAAYAPGVTLNGAGQTVALLQFDGYTPSDILNYESLAGLPNVPLQNVLLDGYNGAPTLNGGEVEVSLDIEMVVSMAPGISRIVLYEAGPFGVPNDILSRMANDNLAKQISCSWGWVGGPQGSTEQIFQQMAVQGQTFFNASGDGDAFLPGQVDDPTFTGSPSSSPNITQVGATTVSTTGPVGSWSSEVVWNWFTTGQGPDGSSGGISSFYPIPIWQQGINMSANGGSATQRNIPDVALTGDNVLVIADGQQLPGTGGTSCAAPLWGGFAALMNQQAAASGQPSIGFINPAIYAIALGPNYTACFHDITVGNNTNLTSTNLFFATTGYDLCTGLGTPTGSNLINTLVPPQPVPVFGIAGTTVVGGNGNGVIDYDECNSLFIVLTNLGSQDATTIKAQLSTTTPGVAIANANAFYPDLLVASSATNLTGFQISTTPSFVCGTPIFFTMVIRSAQGTFTKVFTVNTGSPSPIPFRFDNSSPVNIDSGTAGTSSSILVNGIGTGLTHVSVSAFVQESTDNDLTLQLIGPDGTTVTLAQGDGGPGANYGVDCIDGDRTTFDDGGSSFLNAGFPPFNSIFKPDSALTPFIGKVGTNVNGLWQLHAIDTFGKDVGSIQCWSLFLSPAQCIDGGGQCPGVDLSLGMTASPNPVLIFSNLTYSISVTNNGPDTATSVAFSQTLPGSVTFVTATASRGLVTQAAGVVSCNLGTMGPGETASITVTVIPNASGTIFSSASVGAQQNELNSADNSATVAVIVQAPSADLGVTLGASPNPVLLNGPLIYTALVVNHGPFVATNVVVSNTLPVSALFVSGNATQGSVDANGNIVVASLGTLAVGSNATVTIQVRPQAAGSITATARVSSALPDLISANNVSTANVTVTSAADLALTTTGPTAAISGSNVTYIFTVQNLGLSAATAVNIRDTFTPASLHLIQTNSAQGTVSVAGNVVSCLISNLGVGASASMSATFSTSNFLGNITNNVAVTAAQADPNTTNNSATLVTIVANPIVNVAAAGETLQTESYLPANGMIEPGEKVTLLLRLQNLGNVDTGNNLMATLLSSNGVSPVGAQVQNYGTLSASGGIAGRPFTFVANGTNGATIVATLAIQNNGTNLANVSFTNTLPAFKSFTNLTDIVIPDQGEGTPYPSTDTVSGVTGTLGRVTVTMTNVNHTFPDDIDMLLVGPVGQTVLLMSHCGTNGVLTNTSITFDDGAVNGDGTTKFMPITSGFIASGSYAPTQSGTNNLPTTNTPPPFNGASYSSGLVAFNGTNPNGKWKLYVFDRNAGDQGIIKGGYSLGFISGNEVNPVVDLSLTGKATPSPVVQGGNLTYTFTITNLGPNSATSVQFTNVLPANVVLVSATNSAHAAMTTNGGMVVCSFPTLNLGSNIIVTVVVSPLAGGTLTSVATVSSTDSDPQQSNNSATVVTTSTPQLADLSVTMTGPTNITIGSPGLYTVKITNNGPNSALNVVVTDPLQNHFILLAGTSTGSLGDPFFSPPNAVCNVGTIPAGGSAVVTLSLTCTQAITLTNTVTVTTLSTDGNFANNSASIVTAFTPQTPHIVAAGARLLSGQPNGTIVPGQVATVSFQLANDGSSDTTSLVATLQANGNLTPAGLQQQNYGVLLQGGPAVGSNFTFTASGANGGTLTATLLLSDDGNALPPVSFVFNLPSTNSYANSNGIIIPDHGTATPYPAQITVTNVTGVVSKATVTLNAFAHQFPNDVEVLLAAPSGRGVVLMAGTGGGFGVSNLTLTFDDAALASLPASSQLSFGGQLVSGIFRPSNNGLVQQFPNPAPAGPFGTTLESLDGLDPNGTWTLFVLDNSSGDSGNIASGWSLNLTTVSPVNQAADLGLTLAAQLGSFYPGSLITYSATITNQGPAVANNVTIANLLPAGLNFVSTSLATHSTDTNGALLFNVGTLNPGTSTSFTITVQASAPGGYINPASVSSDQTDVNPLDNNSQVSLQVFVPPTLAGTPTITNGVLGLTLKVTGEPGTYTIQSSTSLNSPNWTFETNVTVPPGTFTETNITVKPAQYFRVVPGGSN